MTTDAVQPTRSTPDYVAAFDLECDPWEDRHEARFFYADPALMQRLDLLQHLTRFSEQLLYVRAPAGAGKTMLLHQLRLRAADHWRLCQLEDSPATAAELYVQLSRCYPDAASENTEHFGSDLVHYCLGLQQSGQLAVLLIDDAERLPAPVLEALLNLARSPGETLKALRILLFATPELEPTLQSLALDTPGETLVHTLDLPPFDEQQSAAYLMYRLAIAGYSGDSPFSGTEVRAMHKTAAGRPGALNALARETLQEQLQRRALPRRSTAAPGTRRRWPWVAATALVLLGLLVGGWWQLASRVPGPGPSREQNLPLPPANPLASSRQPPGDTAAVPGEPAPATAAPAVPALAEGEPDPQPAEAQPVPAPAKDSTESAPTPPASGATAATAPAAPGAAPSETTATPAPEPTPPTAEPATGPGKADSATAGPATPAPADWLARQPDDHYTLQLLGARARETVQRFLDRHGDRLELHTVQTRREGAAWHLVLTGSYPDRDAAAAAIEALPAGLRGLKPWPRRFEQIRAELPPV